MKKNLFTFLLALFPLFAFADAVEIDGIYYNLISKGKIAEVTSNPSKYSGDVVIPSSVVYESTEYNVKSIGDGAFSYCTDLTSVVIPNSVTTFGTNAFGNCTNLTSIDIPNSVTTIGWSAFSHSGLTSVDIPNSVTSINVFAFYYCSDLVSVTIPNSVTTIEESTFEGCTSLTSINIPNSITTIGHRAFRNCTSVQSISIPNSVAEIGESVFTNCTALKSITIPNSVTTMGINVFSSCTSLYSVTLPSNLHDIRNGSFNGCTSLNSISIPNNVWSIGHNAFYGCNSLQSITIPNSVTSIDYGAFQNCSNLRTVTIGTVINNIKSSCFAYCDELTDVYCFAESVPTTVSDAFENSYVDYATLHVLAASVSSYSASAPWSGFGTKVAITSEDITIGDLGIGTFCGSNPIDLSGTEDVKAYVVSSYEKATGQVTLTRTYYVPPFTGVVVKGNKGVYTIPAGVGEPVYPNMMKGVTANTALNKVSGDYTNYVLANKGGNLGFYAVTDGSTLTAGKAYLPLPTDDLPTAAREFTLIFDDGETTEIMKVVPQKEAPQGYYDLQGRRVANPTSGLYIVNGKKVIIK